MTSKGAVRAVSFGKGLTQPLKGPLNQIGHPCSPVTDVGNPKYARA